MQLFKRTYLQGLHDGLVDNGVMSPFPSDEIAIRVFDKIAQDANLPMVLEGQLSKAAGLSVARAMKQASDQLAQNGYAPNAHRLAMAKQASLYDPQDRARLVARYYMDKAAADGSLTDNNENTLANAGRVDQLAAVDQSNRPEGTYRVTRGETDLPVPGVIGREVPAPHAPTTGTTVKAADAVPHAEPPYKPPTGHELSQHGETWTSRKNQILDILGLSPEGDATGLHGAGTRQALGNVGQALRDHLFVDPRKQLGLAQAQHSMMQGLEEGTGAYARMRAARNANIGGLAAQGLGAAAGVVGLGLGARALYNHLHQPGPEDMEVTAAAAASPVDRAVTFLLGLHNKTAGWIPSEHAKVAAAGLAAIGTPGLEAMSTILQRVKTADDAESELHQVLQVLDANGVPAPPELVQALAEALAGPPAGPPSGGDGGGPPSGDDKTAAMEQMTLGLSNADKVQNHGVRAAKALSDAAKAHPQAVGAGKALAGVAGLAAIAAGAKKLHDHVRGQGGDKEAADAFWLDILKAAGEGSLTPNDENTLANAAKDDQLAKVDQKNRAEGKYKKPQGQTELSTESGEVGAEKAAEEAYLANLRKTANDWGSKLPASMPIEKKREEITKIAALLPSQRAAYVQSLYA